MFALQNYMIGFKRQNIWNKNTYIDVLQHTPWHIISKHNRKNIFIFILQKIKYIFITDSQLNE